MNRGDGRLPDRAPALHVPIVLGSSTCSRLECSYNIQRSLCSRLENIADGLPNEVDRSECLVIARTLSPMLRMAHMLEEEALLSPLKRTDSGFEKTARRLEFEHLEDLSFADEIAEAMTDFLNDGSNRTAVALGYMLRGFFQNVRRHIAFEQETLLPQLSGPRAVG